MWGILKTESSAIKTQSCGEKNLINELNSGLSVLLYPNLEYGTLLIWRELCLSNWEKERHLLGVGKSCRICGLKCNTVKICKKFEKKVKLLNVYGKRIQGDQKGSLEFEPQ